MNKKGGASAPPFFVIELLQPPVNKGIYKEKTDWFKGLQQLPVAPVRLIKSGGVKNHLCFY